MIDPQLEKALESREVLRLQENGIDVRLYDTDQVLILGKKRIDRETKRVGNKRVTEELEVKVAVSYDLRTGRGNYSIEGHDSGSGYHNVEHFHDGIRLLEAKGIDLHKWDVPNDCNGSSMQRHPEFSEFIDSLHTAFVNRKWERHELAIKRFLPTLAGHGNMHPLALLHPRVMWAYLAGTVFPFERIDVFNFDRGRKNLEGKAEYLSSEQGVSYDGNVVLIRPWDLSDENERDHTTIEAHFFNPANYKRFWDGTLKVENTIPSRRDWKFEITYGIDHGRKWLHFSAGGLDNVNFLKESLLDQKKNDIYLKIDDSLMVTLEKIAPLSLDSVCYAYTK